MKTFTDDLKYVWQKPNNALPRIIIINVAVFIILNLVSLLSPSFGRTLESFVSMPSDLIDFFWKPWTIVTYSFTHVGFFHIFWNMIVFYWFGQIVQEFMGNDKLIGLYILGGMAGALAYLLASTLIPAMGDHAGPYMMGASAGVFATVFGAATLQPDYRMSLIFIGPVKIKYIAAVTFLLSLFSIRGANAGGEIAHMGGALLGYLFVLQLRKGNDWSIPVMNALDWLQSFFQSKPKMKVTYNDPSYKRAKKSGSKKSAKKGSEVDQQIIDEILDKIHSSGYEKLTKEEKQILFKASQKDKE